MEFHAWEEGAESASMSTNPGGKSSENRPFVVAAPASTGHKGSVRIGGL